MKSPRWIFPTRFLPSSSMCPCSSILRTFPSRSPPSRRLKRRYTIQMSFVPGKMFSTCSLALIWFYFFYPHRKVTLCARTASSSWLMLKQKPRPTPHSLTRSLQILRTSVTSWDRPCLHWLERQHSEGFMNCMECNVCVCVYINCFSSHCSARSMSASMAAKSLSRSCPWWVFQPFSCCFTCLLLKKSLHVKVPF